MEKSYTETLADFAAATRFEDLSTQVVHDTKRLILDTIACSVGSHFTDAGKIVVEVGRERGGAPEATILVTGEKTSCGNASYVNAALANFMDFDDIMCHAGGHLAQCAVLPALAVAERQGSSGKDLITAVAVGFEVTTRIGVSLRRNLLFNPDTGKMELAGTAGQTWAAFAAAAAAGKLMGFDGAKMAHAFGLAGYSAPVPTIGKYVVSMGKWGVGSPEHGGVPMSKYTMYGAIAEAGVMGALLAAKGFTGDRTVLDGDRGFWRIVGSGGFDFERLVKDLGRTWNVGETSLKPYPVGRDFQSPMGVFEKLVKEHDLAPEDIDRVECGVFAMMAEHMHHLSILNQVDAQMNLPFGLAMIALGYAPGPEWETPARFTDAKVRAFMEKVKVYPWAPADQLIKQEQTEGVWKGAFPCKVDITAGERRFSGAAEYTKGDPWLDDTRMSDDDLARKFRNLALGLLRTDRAERAIETIYNLEKVGRVDELVRQLT